MEYAFYVADCETTGLDEIKCEPIEISIIRCSDGQQKTWHLKPINYDNIQHAALRINGHKLEDLKHLTKYGSETYRDPNQVIIEIENWLLEDGVPAENRCLVGQNVSFDKAMFERLWEKCNSKDSFPFGRRSLNTDQIELFFDFCKGNIQQGYSLRNLVKNYNLKNDKAHSAAADTKVTKEVFEKQVEYFKSLLK